MLKVLEMIQLFNFIHLNLTGSALEKKCLIFDQICLKKSNAFELPYRQNGTPGKMLLGKLELGKRLPRQNVD